MSTDSTRALLFGIFVLAGRKLTATQVIALAKPLKILATNVKSHLTRMVSDGSLERSGPVRRAQYWPSQNKAEVVKSIVERLGEGRAEVWDGNWLMLTLRMPANRAQRERLAAALWFDGFRPIAACTFVRPAWPKRWAIEKAKQYLAPAPGFCLRGGFVGTFRANEVSSMYGLDSLDREASRLARWISAKRIPKESAAAAFAARLEVGGLVARLVGHDPRLPPAIWGGRTGMRALVRAFRRFEARTAPLAQQFLEVVIKGGKAK